MSYFLMWDRQENIQDLKKGKRAFLSSSREKVEQENIMESYFLHDGNIMASLLSDNIF